MVPQRASLRVARGTLESVKWPRFAPLALCLCCVVSPATADEIHLTNGRVIEGDAQRLADGQLEVVTAYGRLTLPATLIDRVEPSVSLRQVLARARAALDDRDPAVLLEMALWCREEGAYTQARELLEEVLLLDPDHPEARRLLGYQRYRGQWLTDEEVHLARGEVWHDGRWMPAAQRDRLLALETARQQAAAAARYAAARRAEVEAEAARQAAAYYSQPGEPWGSGVLWPGPYFGGVSTVAGHYHGNTPSHSPHRLTSDSRYSTGRSRQKAISSPALPSSSPPTRAAPRSHRSSVRSATGDGVRANAGSRH